MNIKQVTNFSDFSPEVQANVLSSFLYELTLGVRDIHANARPNVMQQLYGMNQLNHLLYRLYVLSCLAIHRHIQPKRLSMR